MSTRRQRWRVVKSVARALLATAVLVALYYLLPLDALDSDAATVGKLALGFGVFLGVMTWQVREITRSGTPGLRALEGLGFAVPLFLVLFASTYFLMGDADESSFSAPLTRTDALYFTVTIFSTVGFGDLAARAQSARIVVTVQMVLDLIILGAGARILLTAVQRGRERVTGASGEPVAP